MGVVQATHIEELQGDWADRHPVASAALATATTAAMAVVFARESVERPKLSNIATAAALSALAIGGVVETVRPGTFRLWERLEEQFK